MKRSAALGPLAIKYAPINASTASAILLSETRCWVRRSYEGVHCGSVTAKLGPKIVGVELLSAVIKGGTAEGVDCKLALASRRCSRRSCSSIQSTLVVDSDFVHSSTPELDNSPYSVGDPEVNRGLMETKISFCRKILLWTYGIQFSNGSNFVLIKYSPRALRLPSLYKL